MAKTVSLTKRVRVESDTEVAVEVTVYRVSCDQSGHGEVEFDVESDSDGDLIMTVEPCGKCLSAAHDEGYDEAEKETGV